MLDNFDIFGRLLGVSTCGRWFTSVFVSDFPNAGVVEFRELIESFAGDGR